MIAEPAGTTTGMPDRLGGPNVKPARPAVSDLYNHV